MMRTRTDLVGYPRQGRDKDAPSRQRSGRVCEVPNCTTILSTYNSDLTCYLHTPLQKSHVAGR
jgi:hypothetical protein